MGARVAHVRELKSEIERLRRENTHLRGECESLRAHFDLALLAAEDLRSLPEGGRLEVWDGWNLVLGAKKEARDRDDLVAQAVHRTESDPSLFVWIVFDGPRVDSKVDGRVRISYTGGEGTQRADRLVVDYLRMAVWLGLGDKVSVRTNDKDFLRQVGRIKTVSG
jgi:hypothetical protein